jgi:hypothetical protein
VLKPYVANGHSDHKLLPCFTILNIFLTDNKANIQSKILLLWLSSIIVIKEKKTLGFFLIQHLCLYLSIIRACGDFYVLLTTLRIWYTRMSIRNKAWVSTLRLKQVPHMHTQNVWSYAFHEDIEKLTNNKLLIFMHVFSIYNNLVHHHLWLVIVNLIRKRFCLSHESVNYHLSFFLYMTFECIKPISSAFVLSML